MSALVRLFARARNEIAGIREAIDGSQSQRIVDQEIRETDTQLHAWRLQLGELQAHRHVARERRDAARDAVEAREGQALRALQAGDTELAREVAAAIVALERQHESEAAQLAHFEEQCARMQRVVGQGENTLRRLRHQLDMIRATESVQQAQAAVASRQAAASGAIQTAIDSAQRLKARTRSTAMQDAFDDAALQDAFADLDDKLRRAGILDVDLRVDAVMQRIEARATNPPAPAARTRARSKR